MFRYSKAMELVFGKNYVGVQVVGADGDEGSYVHGYLAVRADDRRVATCISWLPLEDIVRHAATSCPPQRLLVLLHACCCNTDHRCARMRFLT